jgi:hypothetical protein
MLQDVIARFSTAAADGSPSGYMVTRTAAPTFSSTGLIVSGSTSTFTTDAHIEPYSGRGLEVLPEGVHVSDVRVIDTTVSLQVNPPDSVTIAGDSYAVFRSDGPFNFPDGSRRYTSYAARQAVPG